MNGNPKKDVFPKPPKIANTSRSSEEKTDLNPIKKTKAERKKTNKGAKTGATNCLFISRDGIAINATAGSAILITHRVAHRIVLLVKSFFLVKMKLKKIKPIRNNNCTLLS